MCAIMNSVGSVGPLDLFEKVALQSPGQNKQHYVSTCDLWPTRCVCFIAAVKLSTSSTNTS
eukprot:scaffold202462_cov31-Prasinocladus_malaysianus.AAC.1